MRSYLILRLVMFWSHDYLLGQMTVVWQLPPHSFFFERWLQPQLQHAPFANKCKHGNGPHSRAVKNSGNLFFYHHGVFTKNTDKKNMAAATIAIRKQHQDNRGVHDSENEDLLEIVRSRIPAKDIWITVFFLSVLVLVWDDFTEKASRGICILIW